MTKPLEAAYPPTRISEKIIVALDVGTAAEARAIVSELGTEVGGFKIGLQLFTAEGPGLVREFTSSGQRVFLDLKFHDIPNTVACAAAEAARLGVWMFNVHTLGGSAMMRSAADAVQNVCGREGLLKPMVIGVTILTSADQASIGQVGIDREIGAEVLNLARLAGDSGLDGVVASPLETEMIRSEFGDKPFAIVTPGIRDVFATGDDQRRVTTLGQALARGADYAVIGRPITGAPDMLAAVRQIVDAAEI